MVSDIAQQLQQTHTSTQHEPLIAFTVRRRSRAARLD